MPPALQARVVFASLAQHLVVDVVGGAMLPALKVFAVVHCTAVHPMRYQMFEFVCLYHLRLRLLLYHP